MNSLIIPAYNEEKCIETVVTDAYTVLRQYKDTEPFEIIVVDDGSSDSTSAILTSLQPKFAELIVLRHKTQRGVGAARSTGVLQAKGDKIAFVDADTTYDAHDLPAILDALSEYDMAVGARKEEKGTLKILRASLKSLFKTLASLLTHSTICDLNSGIRGMDRSKTLEFLYLLPKGHSWVSTITLCFLASGYTVQYLPANYFKRTGTSSFKIFRDSYAMFMTIIKTIIYFYPLRVIIPLSFAFFAGGGVFLVRDIIQRDIADSTILFFIMGVVLFIFALISEQMACLRREINQKYCK